MKCKCDNCDWKGPEKQLRCDLGELFASNQLYERIEPGGIVPAGECPKCGCLAYLDGVKPQAFFVLELQGDVEPVLYGPYAHREHRDDIARKLRAEDGDSLKNGLYRLNADAGAYVSLDTFSGTELEPEQSTQSEHESNDKTRCLRPAGTRRNNSARGRHGR